MLGEYTELTCASQLPLSCSIENRSALNCYCDQSFTKSETVRLGLIPSTLMLFELSESAKEEPFLTNVVNHQSFSEYAWRL